MGYWHLLRHTCRVPNIGSMQLRTSFLGTEAKARLRIVQSNVSVDNTADEQLRYRSDPYYAITTSIPTYISRRKHCTSQLLLLASHVLQLSLLAAVRAPLDLLQQHLRRLLLPRTVLRSLVGIKVLYEVRDRLLSDLLFCSRAPRPLFVRRPTGASCRVVLGVLRLPLSTGLCGSDALGRPLRGRMCRGRLCALRGRLGVGKLCLLEVSLPDELTEEVVESLLLGLERDGRDWKNGIETKVETLEVDHELLCQCEKSILCPRRDG